MNWTDNINTIQEIYPGHFRIVLNFASTKILSFVLSDEYEYVWVCNHSINNSLEWGEYMLPLFDNENYQLVLGRNISFDYVMTTHQFVENIHKLSNGIHLIQMNRLPKYYLDVSQIKGKILYDLLRKECDYLFEIDVPGAVDYGTIVSSNRDFLQKLLDNTALDWSNLP
jgi:hypothetical protein